MYIKIFIQYISFCLFEVTKSEKSEKKMFDFTALLSDFGFTMLGTLRGTNKVFKYYLILSSPNEIYLCMRKHCPPIVQ